MHRGPTGFGQTSMSIYGLWALGDAGFAPRAAINHRAENYQSRPGNDNQHDLATGERQYGSIGINGVPSALLSTLDLSLWRRWRVVLLGQGNGAQRKRSERDQHNQCDPQAPSQRGLPSYSETHQIIVWWESPMLGKAIAETIRVSTY